MDALPAVVHKFDERENFVQTESRANESNSSHELHFSNEQPAMGGGTPAVGVWGKFLRYLNYEVRTRLQIFDTLQ